MAERDAEFAAKHGLTNRYDMQNLREVMQKPGWDVTLARLLQQGAVLPGVAIAYGSLNEPE